MTVAEICRKHGICDQTYYRWKSKYGGLEVSEARRLRRPFLSDRYIFVTVKVLKPRRHLSEGDFKRLASAMSRMRPKHRFLLTAWLFLPDHGHAIIDPPYPLTISRAMKAVKVSSMISLNQGRREAGEFWQGRCFDRALRTVKGYLETAEYIPRNPVRRGLVKRADEWKWSSVRESAQAALVLLVTRH